MAKGEAKATRRRKRAMLPRERRFIEAYLEPWCTSAAQAARKAGYKDGPGIFETASRLLKRADVAAEVKARLKRYSEGAEERSHRVLRALEEESVFDPADFYDEQGRLLPIHDVPEGARRALAGLDVLEEFDGTGAERVQIGEVKKVRFIDRLRAQELLAKNLKLLTDKTQLEGGDKPVTFIINGIRR